MNVGESQGIDHRLFASSRLPSAFSQVELVENVSIFCGNSAHLESQGVGEVRECEGRRIKGTLSPAEQFLSLLLLGIVVLNA